MLVALWQGVRVEAALAQKANKHYCPGCGDKVIQKRGRKVSAHFAHKTSAECHGSRGETHEHHAIKSMVAQDFRRRGVRTEIEYCIGDTTWERRADVMIWTPRTNKPIAIEVQRSALSIDELEVRALSYCHMNVAQLWLPLLSQRILQRSEHMGGRNWYVSRYTPKHHEVWIHGLYGHDGCWMVDPSSHQFWHATLIPHELLVKETLWYEMGAIKRYRPPTTRQSKRYRDLKLQGPFALQDLKVAIKRRAPQKTKYFSWPGGQVATLIDH